MSVTYTASFLFISFVYFNLILLLKHSGQRFIYEFKDLIIFNFNLKLELSYSIDLNKTSNRS
jgi:hypothetical protein